MLDSQEEQTDENLATAYIKGDQNAFEILVQRHLNGVYNFIYKYVHTASEAEDVSQDAFVKAWKNMKKFDQKYKFKTWLYTIAKNTALDSLRRKGSVPFAALESSSEQNYVESLVDYKPLPDEAMLKLEDAEMLHHAAAKLSSKYKLVLNLYYGSGLNFREISEKLGESLNTIKTRHRRALKYLKLLLDK